MELTKTIKIGGIDYRIQKRKDYFDSPDCHMGLVDFKSATITLADDLDNQVEKQTLWHEVLHAMLSDIGRDDLSSDETFVQSLASSLNQTAYLKIKSDPMLPFEDEDYCNPDYGEE